MSRKSFFLWLMAVIVFGVHLDRLNQQIVRIQTELKTLRDLPSAFFSVESKITALENILLHKNFSQARGIHVFKSAQSVDDADDAVISNAPGQAKFNWGAGPRIGAGYDADGNNYRTLIRFNDWKKSFPQGTAIMAATIYLKQIDNEDKDNRALRENFNVWEVGKKWDEGNKKGSKASPGEVTWNAAAEGMSNWDLPGCFAPKNDLNKDILMATTGPNVNDAGNGWIAFCFTPTGISRLEQKIQRSNELDYGFLIELGDEVFKKKNTFVSFHSSDDETVSYRPYLEIIYFDQSISPDEPR